MARSLVSLALAAGLVACSAAPPPPAPPPPVPPPPPVRAPSFVATEPPEASRIFDVRLNPSRDAAGEVSHIEIELRLSEPPGEFGDASPLVLSLAEEDDGEAGWPEAIEEVYARDGEGALTLKQVAVPATAEVPAHSAWRSDRHPEGAINISYRVRVSHAEGKKFQGSRAHAGGFQGTGKTLLLRPDTPDVYTVRIGWELGNLGDGAVGLCSFGEDAVDVALPLDRLDRAVFMAGSLGRLSIDDGDEHVLAAWLGRPGFDPVIGLSWAARAFSAERRFFHDRDDETFHLFLRAVPRAGAARSISSRPGGLLFLAGEEVGLSPSTRLSLARALVRRWIGGSALRFTGPEAHMAWFNEGFASHLARDLVLRAGLATPAEALDDLEEHVTRFSLSPVARLSNDEIEKRFATSAAVQELAEDRGMFYAAELDAAIQAKSGGKRSLDDFLLALIARATPKAIEDKPSPAPAPQALAPEAFRDALGEELGQDARARHDAIIARGEAFLPPSNAYGPCFKLRKKNLSRFELGFDEASIQDKRVHGLSPTSAAGRAGLREGEVIVRAEVPRSADKQVEITVLRDGKEKVIRYLPQGEVVKGQSWERVSGVPDSACARPLPKAP